MKSKTKAELVTENATLSKENSLLLCALHDIAVGEARTFKASRYHYFLTITRPAGAAGGIAIVNHAGTVAAHYFEQWGREELNAIALLVTGTDTEFNRELLARREVIQMAQAYVTEQQKAA